MHFLYILAFYICHMQPQLVDLYATHRTMPVCVEIQKGMYSLYYTISYSLLVGMPVVPPYDVPNLFSSYYESCHTAFDMPCEILGGR